eukprot:2297642-Pleurochrysis_carterae.AAC.2
MPLLPLSGSLFSFISAAILLVFAPSRVLAAGAYRRQFMLQTVPSACAVLIIDDLPERLPEHVIVSLHSAKRTAHAHQLQSDGSLLACDCCGFGRDPSNGRTELRTFEEKPAALKAARTIDTGNKELYAFVSSQHKRKHHGTPSGPADGTPLTHAALSRRWIVDLLHVDLNEGKLTWKWSLTRRLPCMLPAHKLHGNVRSRVSDCLKELGLPLDLRMKEEGRVSLEKFYDCIERAASLMLWWWLFFWRTSYYRAHHDDG